MCFGICNPEKPMEVSDRVMGKTIILENGSLARIKSRGRDWKPDNAFGVERYPLKRRGGIGLEKGTAR